MAALPRLMFAGRMAAVAGDLSFVRTGFFAKGAAVFFSRGSYAFARRVGAFLCISSHKELLFCPQSQGGRSWRLPLQQRRFSDASGVEAFGQLLAERTL